MAHLSNLWSHLKFSLFSCMALYSAMLTSIKQGKWEYIETGQILNCMHGATFFVLGHYNGGSVKGLSHR